MKRSIWNEYFYRYKRIKTSYLEWCHNTWWSSSTCSESWRAEPITADQLISSAGGRVRRSPRSSSSTSNWGRLIRWIQRCSEKAEMQHAYFDKCSGTFQSFSSINTWEWVPTPLRAASLFFFFFFFFFGSCDRCMSSRAVAGLLSRLRLMLAPVHVLVMGSIWETFQPCVVLKGTRVCWCLSGFVPLCWSEEKC